MVTMKHTHIRHTLVRLFQTLHRIFLLLACFTRGQQVVMIVYPFSSPCFNPNQAGMSPSSSGYTSSVVWHGGSPILQLDSLHEPTLFICPLNRGLDWTGSTLPMAVFICSLRHYVQASRVLKRRGVRGAMILILTAILRLGLLSKYPRCSQSPTAYQAMGHGMEVLGV